MTAPQTNLLGEPAVKLGKRQGWVLQLVAVSDGLTDTQVGAMLHQQRGKHLYGNPCEWCPTEGRQVLASLRKKGLVVRRRSGLWEPRHAEPAAPQPSEPSHVVDGDPFEGL